MTVEQFFELLAAIQYQTEVTELHTQTFVHITGQMVNVMLWILFVLIANLAVNIFDQLRK